MDKYSIRKAARRNYTIERRAAQGLCIMCGRESVEHGRRWGPSCLAKRRPVAAAKHAQAKRDGICRACLCRPRVPPYSYCAECHIRVKAEKMARYTKNRQAGLCGCGRESRPDRQRCITCLERTRCAARQLKADVFAIYGNRCACCGEDDNRFLTVDHVFNDGYKERKQGHRTTQTLYSALRKNGYSERYQLLCWNCNCAKNHHQGVCPHELDRQNGNNNTTEHDG